MSSICLNIISYFGSDPTLREKRKEYHQKQLDWAIDKGYPIFINAMDYNDGEQTEHELISYTTNDRMDAGAARNVLLEKFYKSSYDVSLFLDNDTILYPYYDHEEIFRLLEEDLEQFKDSNIFCFNPAYPRIDPIHGPNGMEKVKGELTIKDAELAKRLETQMDFKSHYMLQTACMFVINPVIHADGKKFFMDTDFIHKEDNDFGYQFMDAGLGVCKTYNIVMNEMGMNNSVMLEGRSGDVSEQEERKQRDVDASKLLGAKWNSDGAPFDKAAFKKKIGVAIGNAPKIINKSTDDGGDFFSW